MEVHDRVLDVGIYMMSQGLNTKAIKSICNLIETGNAQREYLERPITVCLCGSIRFGEAFQSANLKETLAGKIVLSIGCNMKSDSEIFGHLPQAELDEIKIRLDELHKRKIDMADEVMVLNVGGYIGNSTRSEIEYATELGKQVNYLEPLNVRMSEPRQ
jgi:hypothetical protein